jgi:hypothetical protein
MKRVTEGLASRIVERVQQVIFGVTHSPLEVSEGVQSMTSGSDRWLLGSIRPSTRSTTSTAPPVCAVARTRTTGHRPMTGPLGAADTPTTCPGRRRVRHRPLPPVLVVRPDPQHAVGRVEIIGAHRAQLLPIQRRVIGPLTCGFASGWRSGWRDLSPRPLDLVGSVPTTTHQCGTKPIHALGCGAHALCQSRP